MIKEESSLVAVWRAMNGSGRLKTLTNGLKEFQISTHMDMKVAQHAVRESGLIMLNPLYPLERNELSALVVAAKLATGQFERTIEIAAINVAAKVGCSRRIAGEEALRTFNFYSFGSHHDAVKAAVVDALAAIAKRHGGRLADQIRERLTEFIEKDNYRIGSKTHDSVMKAIGSGLFANRSPEPDLQRLMR